MKITSEILRQHNACANEIRIFAELWPDGMDPTPESAMIAQSEGLDAMWCLCLLPADGPGSRRAFALWRGGELMATDRMRRFKHETRLGQAWLVTLEWIGVRAMSMARRILRGQLRACSWCGRRPGWKGSISSVGNRCDGCPRSR